MASEEYLECQRSSKPSGDKTKRKAANEWLGRLNVQRWLAFSPWTAGGALLLRATSNPLSRPPLCPAKSQPLRRRPPPRPFRFTNQNFREVRHHLLPSRPLHHLDNWSRHPSHAIATAQLELFLYRPSTLRQWQLAVFHPLLTKLPHCVQVFPTSLPHVDISLIARGFVHEFC